MVFASTIGAIDATRVNAQLTEFACTTGNTVITGGRNIGATALFPRVTSLINGQLIDLRARVTGIRTSGAAANTEVELRCTDRMFEVSVVQPDADVTVDIDWDFFLHGTTTSVAVPGVVPGVTDIDGNEHVTVAAKSFATYAITADTQLDVRAANSNVTFSGTATSALFTCTSESPDCAVFFELGFARSFRTTLLIEDGLIGRRVFIDGAGPPRPAALRPTPLSCPNSVVEPDHEACDDGNSANDDGCSRLCVVESGFTCSGSPSRCTPTCGDGVTSGNEVCDDGNTLSDDGCASNCLMRDNLAVGAACATDAQCATRLCGNANTCESPSLAILEPIPPRSNGAPGAVRPGGVTNLRNGATIEVVVTHPNGRPSTCTGVVSARAWQCTSTIALVGAGTHVFVASTQHRGNAVSSDAVSVVLTIDGCLDNSHCNAMNGEYCANNACVVPTLTINAPPSNSTVARATSITPRGHTTDVPAGSVVTVASTGPTGQVAACTGVVTNGAWICSSAITLRTVGLHSMIASVPIAGSNVRATSTARSVVVVECLIDTDCSESAAAYCTPQRACETPTLKVMSPGHLDTTLRGAVEVQGESAYLQVGTEVRVVARTGQRVLQCAGAIRAGGAWRCRTTLNLSIAGKYALVAQAGSPRVGAVVESTTVTLDVVECLLASHCSSAEFCSAENACTSTDSDNDGVANLVDRDDDNDGVLDPDEYGAIDYSIDTDGDGIPDYIDASFWADRGEPCAVSSTWIGECAAPPARVDFDRDGLPNMLDRDSDGDAITDAREAGYADANSDGTYDNFVDNDRNGATDAITAAPLNSDRDGEPDTRDLDSDGDSFPDIREAFLDAQSGAESFKPKRADTDRDGIDDAFDPDCTERSPCANGAVANVADLPDTDRDGTIDARDANDDGDARSTSTELRDAAAYVGPSTNPLDLDGDEIPNPYDSDSDGDRVRDVTEQYGAGNVNNDELLDYLDPRFAVADETTTRCPTTSSAHRPHRMSLAHAKIRMEDTVKNISDPDDDNDGISSSIEANPSVASDVDQDGVPNHLDLDSDGDGLSDVEELGFGSFDANLDGWVDEQRDSDGDGVLHAFDEDDSNRSRLGSPSEINSDNAGAGDSMDMDSDGDGLPDVIESNEASSVTTGRLAGTIDSDEDGAADHRDADSDNDTLPDSVEAFDFDFDGVADVLPTQHRRHWQRPRRRVRSPSC